ASADNEAIPDRLSGDALIGDYRIPALTISDERGFVCRPIALTPISAACLETAINRYPFFQDKCDVWPVIINRVIITCGYPNLLALHRRIDHCLQVAGSRFPTSPVRIRVATV